MPKETDVSLNGNIRVLHVDDDANQLEFTKMFLESIDPILNVVSSSSPVEALQMLDEESFDCIVTDYMMSGMNGIEFAGKARTSKDVPIIIYTGQGSEEVAEEAFAFGIDDYIRKEINPSHYQVLAKRIRIAVEKQSAELSLVERERELSWMVENSLDAIFRIEIGRGVTRYNQAFMDILGYSEKELAGSGMEVLPFIHDEDKAQFMKDLDDIINLKLSRYSSLSRWCKNKGGYVWLEASISALVDDGKFTGVEIIARDVTEKVEMDNALKKSEARYRLLFKNMINGFALHRIEVDVEGKPVDYVFLEVNDAFEEFTGLKRDEIIGKRVTEVLPGIENDPADWIGRYGKIALRGGEERFEQFAEPLARWYSVTAFSPRKDYFATVFEEITDRKNYEKKLTALHEQAIQLNKAEDLDDVWESILEAAGTILGFDYFGILVKEEGALREVKSRGLPVIGFTLPLSGKGLTVKAANEKTTVLVNDTRGSPDFVPGSLDTNSEMAVPVVVDADVYAVLNVESKKLDAFSENDQKLLETLAMHTASTIERLMAELRVRELAYRFNGVSPGECYLHASHDGAYRIYADLALHGVPGLCLARDNPESLVSEYGVSPESVVLISSRSPGGFEAVSDLQEVSRVVSRFIAESEAPVVLLDGLEYLVSRFGFDVVFAFIQEKRFDFREAKGVLLVPFDPLTMTDRERALLASELKTLE